MINDDKKKPEEQEEESSIKPDPETLHTTDPQDEMQGPISSLMQITKEVFDTDETREEADARKDEGK